MNASPPICPLCGHTICQDYFEDKNRRYYQCNDCQLVFVAKPFLLCKESEKREYDLHENKEHDPGYEKFLSKVANPLLKKIANKSTGLDFGCGPGPVLASMLRREGHTMAVYDPFFYPDRSVLENKYDFVTCTEAIEHFHSPGKEWMTLLGLLNTDGWLAIMTKRVISKARFANWHYKNDLTHVCFFSEFTFQWLANKYDLNLELVGDDVALFKLKSPFQSM